MIDDTQQDISNIALVHEQTMRVRDLAGFRKSHRVPDEVSEQTRQFVRRIAADDLAEDLDQKYTDIRRRMSLRRTELQVSEPENGTAAIHTRWFEFRTSIDLHPDDCRSVVWRRQLSRFRHVEELMQTGFESAFSGQFDTVEFCPAVPVNVEDLIDRIEAEQTELTVDYDRTATWCRISGLGSTGGCLHVTSDRISLVTARRDVPSKLLAEFFEFRASVEGVS